MFKLKSKVFAGLAALACVTGAFAQDSKALIDLLIQKGILNQEEAAKVQKDLAKNEAASDVATSKGKFLNKITVSGRIQAQFAGLSTDIDGTSADPAAINHFFMRRMYFGVKAELANNITGVFNYDFAGSTFDAAYIEWKANDQISLDAGFRKVPIGYDEWLTSSGKLKAIERSTVTRYFVESNNGRRLGAGSYRQGLFLNGKDPSGFNYQLAITNPERNEDGIAGVNSAGAAANNNFAYWGQAGYSGKSAQGTYTFGASLGYLPDQGGKTVGKGDNLTVMGVYADVGSGPFSVSGEYYWSDNQNGAGANKDANSWGWYVMPGYKFSDKWELVARYCYLDTDGRGVGLADGIRSSATGGTMNLAEDYYVGLNWYINGWDTVLQGGYVWGETKDNLDGTPGKSTVQGLRAQLQINF